jgi:hypothetical protein
MTDPETYQSMLDVLRKHLPGQQNDPEQPPNSLTLGECGAPPGSVTQFKESPNLSKAQSHPSGAVDPSLGSEPRLSEEGRFVCGICGARFYGPIGRNRHEKRHEHRRPHRCPDQAITSH